MRRHVPWLLPLPLTACSMFINIDGLDSGAGGSSASAGSTGSAQQAGSASSASSAGSSGGGGGASASGEPIPNTDLPGWKVVFSDDFTTDAPLGTFPGNAYAAGWGVYDDGWKDTSQFGTYNNEKTLSVSGGALTINVHTEGGVHYVAAPLPWQATRQTYGRYSVRFRAAKTTSDYRLTWNIWPDSQKWPDDGNIIFPSGVLDGTIEGDALHADPMFTQEKFDSGETFGAWHTATIEWLPSAVTFLLDGAAIGTSTVNVPSTPMYYVLQTETDSGQPSDSAVGTIELDWVVIWAKQ